jgi:hypothetical protein
MAVTKVKQLPIIAVLILSLVSTVCAGERKDGLKDFTNNVKGQRFHLKVTAVKINRSGGLSDIHTTHIYAIDSMVVYRALRTDIEVGEGIVESMLSGSDRVIDTDPDAMIETARNLNKKAAGQKLAAGSVVTIKKIGHKKKTATVYIKSPHGISTRIYFKFDGPKYSVENMKGLWDLVFTPFKGKGESQ